MKDIKIIAFDADDTTCAHEQVTQKVEQPDFVQVKKITEILSYLG